MKLSSFVLVAAVLACTVVVVESMHFGSTFENGAFMRGQNRPLRDEIFVADSESVINWTWDSWFYGPFCDDYNKYTVVNLTKDTLKNVQDTADGIFQKTVCQTLSILGVFFVLCLITFLFCRGVLLLRAASTVQ